MKILIYLGVIILLVAEALSIMAYMSLPSNTFIAPIPSAPSKSTSTPASQNAPSRTAPLPRTVEPAKPEPGQALPSIKGPTENPPNY
ncbi:MAG: hypothetical protein A2946_03640 [Candidatus Liptonbacteria bacterium RIFCSPLOWO2_01_FULL_53_13]|uniref:Uncharacterized protein n=1 Tax=Candidatus Liptonbacteria bacterium RIFCSPLOWO2_01_FULL_53_13 TaxID=1798651 RepID=A0A1G2CLB0_9BACT|nr:MAG: hypothetical protein A2946_03640 [Candidatus Liptonbacteria bacterium RIFCSPLOWO2_01_FULL_53_13]